MGLPYYILPMPKVLTTTLWLNADQIVIRPAAFLATASYREYYQKKYKIFDMFLFGVMTVRRTYYRVENLCVSKDITLTKITLVLDFFDHSLWFFVLLRWIQKCRLSILSANITLAFIIDKSISSIILFVFERIGTMCSERKITTITVPIDFCQPQTIAFQFFSFRLYLFR